MDQIIKNIESKYKKNVVMPIEVGDTVKVWVKIVEGERERLQAFEGVVISIRGAGINRTFKVRKISYGVGVERTFLVNSPRVDKIDIIRKARVRRSKLYYLRYKTGKKARLIERLGTKIPKHEDLVAEYEAASRGEETTAKADVPKEEATQDTPPVESNDTAKSESSESASTDK